MTNDDAIVPSKAHSVGFNCMWEADQNFWLDDVKSGSFDLMIVDWPGSSNANSGIETTDETK